MKNNNTIIDNLFIDRNGIYIISFENKGDKNTFLKKIVFESNFSKTYIEQELPCFDCTIEHYFIGLIKELINI